jgi:glycosyltransferase involved in cell wall biosynthesis
MKEDIAPLRGLGVNTTTAPWEGSDRKKPWDYKITAAIPALDTSETLEICIELLRLQTERPYILIIDTGSRGEQLERMRKLQAPDIEIHFLQLNAVQHPSDFPAMAMDIAFAMCRTEFIFATHADCFLKKRTFLSELLTMAKEISPVVGYEMSERAHSDWKGMVSHTATIYHMPTMDKIGFGWSLRRLCNMYNIRDYKPSPLRPNWPDTEILGNYILRYQKIKPHLIGHEENFSRQTDENIDHIRSYTSGKLYSPEYFKKAKEWFGDARNEALERIAAWRTEDYKKSLNGEHR